MQRKIQGCSNNVMLYFKYHYFCINQSGPHQKLWFSMTTKIEQKIGSLQHNLSLPDKFDMADLDTFKLYENPEIFLQRAGFKKYEYKNHVTLKISC